MWQIIGAGAIGCLWAANLQRSGQQVHLISRRPLPTNVLQYHGLDGQCERFPVSCSQTLLNSDAPILVCVKATQVKQAVLAHQHAIAPQQVIILMHNGMGCAEQVQALLPDNPIICATTANACLVHRPLTIQQTGLGVTYLGAFNQQAQNHQQLAEQLNLALSNTHWVTDIRHKLWLKVIINCCINPLTGLYQIKNGELLAAQFQQQITAICAECVRIAQAEQLTFHQDSLLTTVKQVIIATAENYSSMNRDLFFHRETEIDYINGYLLAKAQQYGIAAPILSDCYQQVQARQQSIADNEKQH